MKIFGIILSIVLIILGLLLAIVSPVAGIAAIALGVIGIVYFRKYKKKTPAEKAAATETPAPAPPVKKSIKEDFFVVGMDYYKKAIESILSENLIFDFSKRELIEEGWEGEKVYFYDTGYFSAELVPEPENEFDPNAIAVYTQGVKVGYIKKTKCKQVKGYMDSGRIRKVDIEIVGGKYKYISESGIERGTDDYKGELSIYLEPEE